MKRRYQAYPEYKESQIFGISSIPTHWLVGKVKFVTNNLDKSRVPLSADERGKKQGVYPYYGASGIIDHVDEYIFDSTNILFGEDGANLLARSTPIAFLAKGKYWVNNHAHILSPKDRLCEYWVRVLDSIDITPLVSGSAQPKLTAEALGNLKLVFPPSLEERKLISDFLDHETAKIDTLIEKQQQLIKLLKEKRQAVVSHAVTKGLNPEAPKKDSGVEWLGDVPEHWKVSKFGYISQVVRGGSPRPAGDPTLFNGDYSPWVTVAEITKDDEIYLTKTETFLTKKGSEQCRVFSSGTLLLSNSGATLGVPSILKIDANANDGVVGFESLQLNSEFAYFYLSTLTEDLRERIKQGSGQPNLNTDIVKDIAVPVPPENEVNEIIDSIKQLRNRYSNLIAKADNAIKLMQERRSALISAAVTGKIDVRNWQMPEVSEEEVV
ncbi:restriction endonuclease subunit S [Pseudoalteromonas luteoviolacea]|uniref:restriction endonuclease subunit S n=1 Tax=Pseudoalteromonas luteoviolacea TaxID=43657 RepID=UPI001EEE4230|nr:restriction endonuclease subunit S [Pseudoalteromonas luteoviolacea]MCF6439868.1 restriction endonuclease subunit S [Pseudoalteromonas luteoviolacea]